MLWGTRSDVDVRAIQRDFQSGLDELDPEGALGIAAIQACAEVIQRVRALTPENVAETRAALERLQRELKPIDQAVEAGRFKAALPIALGRTLDMLDGTMGRLDRA